MFPREVFLNPHTIRLQPRSDASQRLVDFQLSLSPQPQGRCGAMDAEGNATTVVWFEELTDKLEIVTQATVDTLRLNPFDFLLTRANAELPVPYGRDVQPLLVASRQRVSIPSRTDPVRAMADELLRATERKLPKFLMSLCNRIYDVWRPIHREVGEPWPPEQTFERQSGSCRDLAWFFVDACRSVGLASRFVSGYQEGDEEQHRRELHAWGEVYIPGAGWRGFDPTHGMAVADRHVAVAAAVRPSGAAPIEGSFRGSGVSATIEYELQLQVTDLSVAS
jgi:transglutaminase-like putative cysteine protease